MRGFSEALRADLVRTHIRVTLVTPGRVSSEYFAHNPGAEERIPAIARLVPTLTPEQVAAALLRAAERRPREVLLPTMLRVFMLAHHLAPRLVEWLAVATGWRRRSA